MTKQLLRPIKLKDGRSYDKGNVFEITFSTESNGLFRATNCAGESFQTRSFNLFFKAPSLATMEKWSDNGVAKTVTGHRTEPDGYGPDGSPSWLLALGMI